MDLTAIPVADGLLPRVYDGLMRGVFVDPFTAGMLETAGVDAPVFLTPFSTDEARLFPVGVIARVEALWIGDVFVGNPPRKQHALFSVVRGLERARAAGFVMRGRALRAEGVSVVKFDRLRSEGRPIICGSGWSAVGGSTDQSPDGRIEVEIQGFDVGDGSDVSLTGRLQGLVSEYQAHTIEHGIIRSLKQYGVCTAKTLGRAIRNEARELRASVDLGFSFEIPEVFGVTQSGQCGNPLTAYARFFLARELAEELKRGKSVSQSLTDARKKTLSELTDILRVDGGQGMMVVQGLHRGMRHDDTPLTVSLLTRVLQRFPGDPWS